ncbi:MAG TPA: ester cyclase [Bryobacteraceae bacterium]|nr:ester cyclase [Bryobacteraceae bacterium]
MSSTPQPSKTLTNEDATFRFLGIPSAMRATADTTHGAFALLEHWEMPVGFASPYHTHHREDESFYVLEGEVAFVCAGNWRKAGPGAFVYGPREIPHGFKVVGQSPVRMLILCTPAGFERFVLEQTTPITEPPSPPDMGKLMMLAAKYGIDIHGPLPEAPDSFGGEAPALGHLKALNHSWIQAFNDRDWQTEAAARGEDFQAHLSGFAAPLDNAGWAGFMQAFTAGFPDSRISIESCIAEGDQVVTRWTLAGTHRGSFQGIPPTGQPVRFTGIEFNRVVNGRLVEHWAMFDNLALLRQIGAMPA